MITGCANRNLPFKALRRCLLLEWAGKCCIQGYQKRLIQNATHTARRDPVRPAFVQPHAFDVFKHLPYPSRKQRANAPVWLVIFESCLPPHLRHDSNFQIDTLTEATHTAQILVAAQQASETPVVDKAGVDILYDLGVVQDRWDAVIWTVKRLVEAFSGEFPSECFMSRPSALWSSEQSLKQLTNDEIDLRDKDAFPCAKSTTIGRTPALDELTTNIEPGTQQHEALRRDCFGQIWRSLANMTMSCADNVMKPEILEIIAYLHHMEMIPTSIYHHHPSLDSTQVQQPPTLRLFSSRILTSLSDAAWRAHEKTVVQEAKTQGADYASVRPEIPGMAYRIHVAGLRPEVWMELILWSCLHGGWVKEGLKILQALRNESAPREWRSLSWRSLVHTDGSRDVDWDEFDRIFNTTPARLDMSPSSPETTAEIRRTISTEVVNAYVDAVLSVMRLTSTDDGLLFDKARRYLENMKELLDRSRLSLSTGSWDSMLLRFCDQHPSIVDRPGQFERLIALSPELGEELRSGSTQQLPDYVMDGSAAVLGLFHRALASRVRAGDVPGALRLFEALQERADSNKHRSIVDFLDSQQERHQDAASAPDDLFSTNFSGIDYPAFDLQIPATTLGAFLDLVIDAKAYKFGGWLVHSRDLDGPVIPQRLYGDPALAPILIRFAAEAGDKILLDKLIKVQSSLAERGKPALPENVLQSFFDSQVNLKRWDAANRILKHMSVRNSYWNPINLAHVIRTMLSELTSSSSDDPNSNFERAKTLLGDMIRGEIAKAQKKHHSDTAMLLTMVAVLDTRFADICLGLEYLGGFFNFQLPTKAFNLALEGVVNAYGAAKGRHVLGLFWSHVVRGAQRHEQFDLPNDSRTHRTFESDSIGRQRTTIRLPSSRPFKVILYGGVRPDITTIRIIFHKAMKELQEDGLDSEIAGFASSPAELAHQSSNNNRPDLSASGMVVWAMRCLRLLDMPDDDILAEVETSLEEHEMQHIKSKIPDMFIQADETGVDGLTAGD